MNRSSKRRCILVVDGHTLYREALCLLLSRMMPDAMVLDVSGEEQLALCNVAMVSLVLLNLSHPYLDSFARLFDIRRRFPIAPVVLFSDALDGKVIQMVRAHGVCGFVHASAKPEDLLAAIHDVLTGKPVFPDGDMRARKKDVQLSKRQRQVLDLLCQGLTNKEIGARLHMSDNTVRTHVSAIFEILEVRNRTEAATLGSHLLASGAGQQM